MADLAFGRDFAVAALRFDHGARFVRTPHPDVQDVEPVVAVFDRLDGFPTDHAAVRTMQTDSIWNACFRHLQTEWAALFAFLWAPDIDARHVRQGQPADRRRYRSATHPAVQGPAYGFGCGPASLRPQSLGRSPARCTTTPTQPSSRRWQTDTLCPRGKRALIA